VFRLRNVSPRNFRGGGCSEGAVAGGVGDHGGSEGGGGGRAVFATIACMKRPFATTVWREGNWYVSQCLEVDIASQGETEEEALANLKEALELHF
jgi:hypothetical protein